MPWLADLLRERPREEVARELADAEPLERPSPDDPCAASWRIPGPGGHVRHYLALGAAGHRAEDKPEWLYGFFLRCCEEAAAAAAAPT